ncbi:unnamed protein product, partial [Hapterophycus canaliculatus]
MLKMIQLGLSFANEKGELPASGCCTWQFNFAFNLRYCSQRWREGGLAAEDRHTTGRSRFEDMYAHDSIQLLKNSGIDFQ